MDTVPVRENLSQQNLAQPATLTASGPFSQQPQGKSRIRRVFNTSSWVVFFALLPITVLIFLSQDSIPGDFFYPVKRGMENVILAAASVNPATRAAFRTDLTQARFKEAQSLVVSKSNASGLSVFIDDVQSTRLEVASLNDDTQRIKAEEKLISKLEEYEEGLSTLEVKTEQNIIAYQFQEIPTATPVPAVIISDQSKTPQSRSSLTLTSTPSPTPVPNSQSKTPALILTPTLTPTPALIPTPTPVKQASSAPLSGASAPTSTPVPSPTLVPTNPPDSTIPLQTSNSTVVLEQRKIAETIKETRQEINKIKMDLEEKRERRTEKEKPDRGNITH